MGNIVLLDDLTINQIAAGEVIERPANVVKELVENAMDAGATSISVEIENGGITYIRITDNGKGIAPDDVALAFERHATSKIRRAEDLMKVCTMGFRGEALASIAAVSKVEMVTRTKDQELGTRIVVESGNIIEQEECGAPVGTSITVRELFYNTPVRYKFLKKDFTEGGYIEDNVARIALIHSDISFRLNNNKKNVLQTSGNGDMQSVVYSVYGRDIATNLLDVEYEQDGILVKGVAGKPEIARSNRSNQLFYVNGRFIKDKILSSATEEAYRTLIPNGKFAFCILNVTLSPELVDVNVHPAKLEVRFSEEGKIFKTIHAALKNALLKQDITIQEHEKVNNNETLANGKSENGMDFSMETPKVKKGLFDLFRPKVSPKTKEIVDENLQAGLVDEIMQKTSETNGEGEETANCVATITKTSETQTCRIDFEQEYNLLRENMPSQKRVVSSTNENFENQEENTFKTPLVQEYGENYFAKENGKNIEESKTNEEEEEDERLTARSISSQHNLFENIAEIEEKAFIPEYEIIGTAFSTYILLQLKDEIYILDQHAAHERVLYEKVKANFYKDGGKDVQMLLMPDILELSKKDMRVILEHKDLFEQAGFVLEEFGENTIKIMGVPVVCYEMNTKDLFLDILDGIDITNRTTTQEVEEKFLATVACKAAVKANMNLAEREIRGLLDQLLQLENPFTCPHGRPTAIRITKTEIEKKFGRK